jgi:hypothetical protein
MILSKALEVLGLESWEPDRLAHRLSAESVVLGPDGVQRLGQLLDGSSEFVETDAGWIAVGNHLNGTTWTTQLSATDADIGVLPDDPDLTLLGWWVMDTALALDGKPDLVQATSYEEEPEGTTGPSGWLQGLGDSAVEVSIEKRSLRLTKSRVQVPVTEALTAAFRATFDARADHDELATGFEGSNPTPLVHMTVEDLLWEALVTHRSAFTAAPIPPINDVIAAAGLERFDRIVANVGFDWDALHRWHLRNRLGSVHKLDDNALDAAELVIGASAGFVEDGRLALAGDDSEHGAAQLLATCLVVPGTINALWGHHLDDDTDPAELGDFARMLLGHVEGPVRAGALWLSGRCSDVIGEPSDAEAALTEAVEAFPEFGPALSALAAFAADRGDSANAVRLLRRAGVANSDELLEEVQGYALWRAAPTAGRNEPCPCGSGRKYKHCHLGSEQLPLIERGPWLYAKARRYARDNRHRPLIGHVARLVSEASGRDGHFLLDLLDSELVADLVLCEAGVFDDFVAERSMILPDDEALLAAQWQLVDRSIFEIERVERDHLKLRDLRTGDRITVTNTNSETSTGKGTLMVGRPLPIAGTWRAYPGFVPIGGPLVDEILAALDEPDPFELAELIGRCLAPTVMANTDGHALVFHEVTYRVSDIDAVRAALASGGFRDDGSNTFTLVRDSKNQKDTIVVVVALDGDKLEVSVNSDERLHEAQRLVAEFIPAAVLLDHDIRQLDELLAEGDSPTRAPVTQPDMSNPEMAAVLDQYMRDLEQRWLDDEIPALKGATPRQAAADPIGRIALERLLDQMDTDGIRGGATFDVDRIRRALGM